MKFARFAILSIELLLCYLLQNVIKVDLPFGSVHPDMLIVIVVSVAWMFGNNAGMIYGFMAGLLLDITSGTPLGFAAVIYMFIGYLSGFTRKIYKKDNNIVPLVLAALGEFIYLSVFYIINFVTRGRSSYQFLLNNLILPRITLTVLVGVFLYKLCQLSISFSRSGDE